MEWLTFAGYTGEIYSSGTLIAEISLGCFLFIPLGGFLFLPTLYGLKLTSVFQVREQSSYTSRTELHMCHV